MAPPDVRTTLLSVSQFHLHVDGMTWPTRMNRSNMVDPTFLWVGSVIFKLHMAICGRPLVVLGSLRKERRPHGSWLRSLICRRQKNDFKIKMPYF